MIDTQDDMAALIEITGRLLQEAGYPPAGQPVGDGSIRLRTISTPAQRKLAASDYGFLGADPQRNLAAWDFVWRHSAYHEVMSQALYYYQRQTLDRHTLRTLLTWVDRCQSWEHADDLAKLFANITEREPGWILPTLRRWNRAADPWRRRLSLTSLIEYASKRSQFLPYEQLISFIQPLLDDDDYYVQKGLGWTLREIGNAYPDETRAFMTANAGRLRPQAWTGATKNLPKPERDQLMSLRKASRRA